VVNALRQSTMLLNAGLG